MDILIIIGIILVILGILGSALPVMPGPILSFGAILLLFLIDGVEIVSIFPFVWFGLGMAFLIIIDYLAPIIGAKYFGASKEGIWGAFFGGVAGVFFFPPLGIFLGAFVGAVLGEALSGKKGFETVKAGFGTLIGSFSVIIMQIVYSLIAALYFFSRVF